MEVLILDRFIYKNGRQIDDGSIDVNKSQSSIWTRSGMGRFPRKTVQKLRNNTFDACTSHTQKMHTYFWNVLEVASAVIVRVQLY